MTMKKIYIAALAACMATMAGAQAQQAAKKTAKADKTTDKTELKQEITLEKDFVPVEKKATKKNVLPKAKKTATTEKVTLGYSDWAVPTTVPAQIPTMLPYGYRTLHNFSGARGYLQFGLGSQINATASAGYRLIDNDTTVLKAWFQHNSTWAGKNTTKLISDNGERLKQRYNDNTFGIDLSHRLSAGTLRADAMAHYDNFNYYGGQEKLWNDNKQTIFTARIGAGWDGSTVMGLGSLNYRAALHYNYTALNRALITDDAGFKENSVQFNAGFDYDRTETSRLGIDLRGNFVSTKAGKGTTVSDTTHSRGLITLTPFYSIRTDMLRAQFGANVDFSFSDGSKLRLSPAVKLDVTMVDGAVIYVDAQGGKRLNQLSDIYHYYRYSTPQSVPAITFVPLDGEAGFKIGPFSGFYLKLYGGYGITNGALLPAFIPILADGTDASASAYAYANYIYPKVRGYKAGAEINYEFRSLFEINLKACYAPQAKEYKADGYMSGYFTGIDRATTVGSADLKVYPTKQLNIGIGLNYRGGRSQWKGVYDSVTGEMSLVKHDLDDVLNLRANASYRFSPAITLWVEAGNLLNRQWDVIAGQGAQKLNVMGGVGLVF